MTSLATIDDLRLVLGNIGIHDFDIGNQVELASGVLALDRD